MKLKQIIKIYIIISIICFLALPVMALPGNDTLKMPSPVRGWNTAPEDAKTWAQTLLDWGAMAAGLVAIGAIVFYFIKGRIADSSGSIQSRNESTEKTIGTIISIVILVVSIAFIWTIFWK